VLIKAIFLSLWIFIASVGFLLAQPSNTAFGLSNVFGNGLLTSQSQLLFYYRSSQAFEITGNEQSFVGALRLAFDYKKMWTAESGFEARADVHIMEPLSIKGRVYDAFNPPSLIINRIDFDIFLNRNNSFTFGISKSPAWTMPFDTLFLPVLFHLGALPNGTKPPPALVVGNRDVPFIYTGFLPWYDTGIWYHLRLNGFELDLGGANGELGLDSNSDKSLQIRIGLGYPEFRTGLTIERGEYGSVPIKEYQHFVKWDMYLGKKESVLFGMEAMLKADGVKLSSSYTDNIQNTYGYKDGYFDAFSVINDTGMNNLFGLPSSLAFSFSGFIFLNVPHLFLPQLELTSHVGLYNPIIFYNVLGGAKNIFDESSTPDRFKTKYRAFLRLTWKWNRDFWMVLSDTYTYDAVFLNRSYNQFYDREDRNGAAPHPLLDNDIYLGFVINF
jgi:hypothetical protein